jgi:hypothetical protein
VKSGGLLDRMEDCWKEWVIVERVEDCTLEARRAGGPLVFIKRMEDILSL